MEGESSLSPLRVVRAALLSNLVIALIKFIAASATGSTALLAEGFHSVADGANQGLLLVGIKLSRRPPDPEHPFGHGKERYFWAFVVSVFIFIIGAFFSVFEGIHKVLSPAPLAHTRWGYLVLLASGICEFCSWRVAYSELRPFIKRWGLFRTLKDSKSPGVFIAFLEDSAAMMGLLLAFMGILLTELTGRSLFDGLASISIGILLGLIAFFVSYETKSLLIGEAVSPEELDKLREAILRVPEVQEVIDILTMHLGPDDVLVNLNVNFADGLTTDQVEEAIDKVEKAIQEALPSVKRIFVEAESIRKPIRREFTEIP